MDLIAILALALNVFLGFLLIGNKKSKQKKLDDYISTILLAMNSVNMSAWVFDLASRNIVYNDAFQKQKTQGRSEVETPEEILANGYIHQNSVEAFKALFNGICTATASLERDIQVKFPSETVFHWERVVLTPVLVNGKVVKAVGTTMDITARKEQENQYHKLVEQMSWTDQSNLVAKGMYNLTHNSIEYYEPERKSSVRVDLGESCDSYVEKLAATALDPLESQKLFAVINRQHLLAAFKEGSFGGSFDYKRKGLGEGYFWCNLRYKIFAHPQSGDVIVFFYSYDETNKMLEKQIVTKLSSVEYDFVVLLNPAADHFTIKGQNSRIQVEVGEKQGSYEKLFMGKIKEIFLPDGGKDVLQAFSLSNIIAQLAEKNLYNVTFTAKEQGELRRKSVSFSYLDETKYLILCYSMDVTKSYQKEQQQLFRTQEALLKAKQASDAKTEFFSRMSHDMRTPMNGILGMVELSQTEKDIAVLQENINKIKLSGQYLLGLINDTLDFQKIESGNLTLEPEVIYGKTLFQSIVEMMQDHAQENGVKFQAENINLDMAYHIKVDPLRVKQIFINLLSNAIKFTPQDGEVKFVIERIAAEGNCIHERFLVQDTGVGMSQEFLATKIFQPFAQEHNQLINSCGGTGLGLSIAKRLVELMGGTIKVESELGVGTSFTVDLFFPKVGEQEYRQTEEKSQKHRTDILTVLVGKRVLLAEDHPLNAEIGKKLLERAGCLVEWATNGQQCVKLLLEHEDNYYDLILMDVRMPVLDGLAATTAIRGLDDQAKASVPIIAMTANAYKEDVDKCLSVGMNGHIAKPIIPKEMYEKIALVLSKESIAR